MKLDDGLEKYQELPRNEYYNKNQELSKKVWELEKIPTVADIADFVNGNLENEKINAIFDFFDNRDDFIKMVSKTGHSYDQTESASFIKKVMSANNEEISKAGYFYKLLMASADDFTMLEEDCKSNGVEYSKNDIINLTESDYNYRIKSMFVHEMGKYANLTFKEFMNLFQCEQWDAVHVSTPLSCNHAKSGKGICQKCAGLLPKNVKNIGTFTTLMVTEHATQSALSSMNEGIKENVNDLLALKYDGAYSWDAIKIWIESLVGKLKSENVAARFYEIALLSRLREDEEGPFISSLKGSINYSGNIFGAYIFTPNNKNFESIIKAKEFEDHSLKLKIAMNDYR